MSILYNNKEPSSAASYPLRVVAHFVHNRLGTQVMTGNSWKVRRLFDFGHFPFGVNKEVVGIHLLLTCSLFACGILRKLLLRVSLPKPISALVRF